MSNVENVGQQAEEVLVLFKRAMSTLLDQDRDDRRDPMTGTPLPPATLHQIALLSVGQYLEKVRDDKRGMAAFYDARG
jgi:hypothetical protein